MISILFILANVKLLRCNIHCVTEKEWLQMDFYLPLPAVPAKLRSFYVKVALLLSNYRKTYL